MHAGEKGGYVLFKCGQQRAEFTDQILFSGLRLEEEKQPCIKKIVP